MFHPQGPTFRELARQALSSTRQGYDLLAPKFDYTPFRTPAAILDVVSRTLSYASPIDAALDVCCGTGAAMKMLLPMCRRLLVGVDFSEPMLRVARAQLETAPAGIALELVEADVLQMPFAAQFDLAVCFGALGHILPHDQPQFVDQIARALRPGGRFVFATAFLPPRWSRRYWLARSFNAAMHVRNWLVAPPFVMFYLTFLLPQAQQLLDDRGFTVSIQRHLFPAPFADACLVIATLERPG